MYGGPLKNIRLIGRNRPKPIFNALSRLRWNCEIFISLNADFADYSVVFCHWAIQPTKMVRDTCLPLTVHLDECAPSGACTANHVPMRTKINDNGAWGPKNCRTTEGAVPHWYCPLRLIISLNITIYSNFSSSNSPCHPCPSVNVRVII